MCFQVSQHLSSVKLGEKRRYCHNSGVIVNPFPNNKSLDWSKLKAFADNNLNVAEIKQCSFWSRKHSGKRRKYWLPVFSLFPTMFSKGSFDISQYLLLLNIEHFLLFPLCFQRLSLLRWLKH